MNLALNAKTLLPLLALLAGFIVLFAPRFLNYAVAGYLILVGLIGFGALNTLNRLL